MPTAIKKPASKKKQPPPNPALEKSLEELLEANQFLRDQRGREIKSLSDPRVYVIDQYIKQMLEILVHTKSPGLRQLVAVCEDSPLIALFKLWKKYRDKTNDPFGFLMTERLWEDVNLKALFQTTTGHEKTRAAAALRSRGLMK